MTEYANISLQAERRHRQNQRMVFQQLHHSLIGRMLEKNLKARFSRVNMLEAMKVTELLRTTVSPWHEQQKHSRFTIILNVLILTTHVIWLVPLYLQLQIFRSANEYPENEADLAFWGKRDLQTMLQFYGARQENRNGLPFGLPSDSSGRKLDAAAITCQFLTYKRHIWQHWWLKCFASCLYHKRCDLKAKNAITTHNDNNKISFFLSKHFKKAMKNKNKSHL